MGNCVYPGTLIRVDELVMQLEEIFIVWVECSLALSVGGKE
jgi:hypothetical protein